MQRLLIITGALLIVLGLAWKTISKLPLGRLPGDLMIDRPGIRVWIPITTMILASLILSAIAWLMRRH
jgi:hypothetical protein